MRSHRSPSYSHSTGRQPSSRAEKLKAAARQRAARKGNSHTEFTPQELEQMVLEAAHQRAEKARSRSGA